MANDYFWSGIGTGIYAGVFVCMILFFLAVGDGEIVNVVEFGERLCESKGLVYDTHEMIEDEQGSPRVPKIYCKKNELSVYDGVVVLGD